MLRVYSVMQLEPLWIKQSILPPTPFIIDNHINDSPVIDDEPVMEEPGDIQVQEEEETAMETGYQEVEQTEYIQQPAKVQIQNSTEIVELEEPEEQVEQEQDQEEVQVQEQEQDQEQEQPSSLSSSSSSASSLSTSEHHQVLSTSPKDQSILTTMVHEDNDEYYEKKTKENSKNDEPTPLTCDLTSITEEDQQVNDSSVISSNGSLPDTPISTSPPRRRVRRDSKFNERRKSMTNKLKRAFSSSNTSSKRNSVAS